MRMVCARLWRLGASISTGQQDKLGGEATMNISTRASALLICLMAATFAGLGCRSKNQEMRRAMDTAGVPFFTQEDNTIPLLTTNEVLRIAYDTAKRDGFNLTGFACTGIHFGGQSTNDWIKGA